METLVLGTRGSKLARTQSQWVADRLRLSCPHITVRLEIIQTRGDQDQTMPLPEIGGKGLFTQELDQRLLEGRIDFAVHSMKDLPTDLPEGIAIVAVPQREDPRDALLSRDGVRFADLPPGARVGTGSVRRAAQLKRARSDLRFQDIRGNVDTRIAKVQRGEYDAVVLAVAGLRRLGLSEAISECFDTAMVLPAAAQGALALTGRVDDPRTRELLSHITDAGASRETSAERALLAALGGGCHVPIAANAVIVDSRMTIDGLVSSPDGAEMIRDQMTGPAENARELGRKLAERLLDAGAGEILDTLK